MDSVLADSKAFGLHDYYAVQMHCQADEHREVGECSVGSGMVQFLDRSAAL